jgi:MinD-like ATPase involved in chromosome partitioning or flagellar assembly
MTIAVATVLSAREWEPGLVTHARNHATIRVVVRAFQPQDIERHIDDVDVIVVGGEVSWVTPASLASWRSRGVGIVGVVPEGDRPAHELLVLGGVDEVVPESAEVTTLVQAIRFAAPHTTRVPSERRGSVVGVIGARGAPGCTEVAISYAMAHSSERSTVLVDADLDAPSIAVRLGLRPRPDLSDAADHIRSDGVIDGAHIHETHGLDVIVGSHRPEEAALAPRLVGEVLRYLPSRWDLGVIDLGASVSALDHLESVDEAILVVDASALGIVRAARLVEQWIGPAPALVLNRVTPATRAQSIDAVRTWTGLEPAVVVADRPRVRRASCSASAPERRFSRAVARLGEPR